MCAKEKLVIMRALKKKRMSIFYYREAVVVIVVTVTMGVGESKEETLICWNQGCRNSVGWGDIFPQWFDCIPPLIWPWSTFCISLTIWLWSASERWMMFGPFFGLHVIPEKKLFSCWWKPFFWSLLVFGEKNSSIFGVLFLVFSLNLLTKKKSWSKFIPPNVENRGKIANYPPMLKKNRYHWLK